MLRNLVIIRIKSMFAGMFSREKKKAGKGRLILFALLGVYLLVCFGVMFGGIFFSICDVFADMGLSWLYFGFMGILVFVLCFVGSVFITQNQLYEAKDNDLLLSMPIPVKYILISRLLSIVILNYIYELMIILPGAVVYCIRQPVHPAGAVFFLISFLVLPLLVLTFSALFGWIIALVNTRMRSKNVVVLVLTMVLFLGYLYLCLRLQTYLQKLIDNGQAIGEAVEKALPPFYHMGRAIAEGDVLSFGLFLAFCIVPFVIVYLLLSRSFIHIATTNRGQKKIVYRESRMKKSGVRAALLKKEMRHFLGNPMYIFNAAIGLPFTVIGAVYLFVKKDDILEIVSLFPGGTDLVGSLLCAGFGILASLTVISAPMISIEAKTLWISRSLPLRERDILLSKADVHTLSSLPFVFVSVLLMEIAFPMSLLNRILLVLFPLAVTLFNAYMGIVINLKYPKFDWVNETDAVKQGLAPFLAIFVSMATVILPVLLYVLLLKLDLAPSINVYLCIVCALFAAGAGLLYRYLVTRGVRIFRNLQN